MAKGKRVGSKVRDHGTKKDDSVETKMSKDGACALQPLKDRRCWMCGIGLGRSDWEGLAEATRTRETSPFS
jgi:hypothetical protein